MLRTAMSYSQNAIGGPERLVEGLTRDEVTHRFHRKILLIARQLADRLPSDVFMEFEDLVSYGAIGLLEAFERFDEDRGILFSTFAEYRIRGAMLDALRSQDTFSRRRRQLARRIESAHEPLRLQLSREPEPQETAELLGIDMDEYWSALDRVKPVTLVSIESTMADDNDEGRSLVEQLASQEENPSEKLLIAEMRRELESAVLALPEKQRHCIMMYYGRELSLAEIAEVYKVTPSRVSQILTEARGRLRKKLGRVIDVRELEMEVT